MQIPWCVISPVYGKSHLPDRVLTGVNALSLNGAAIEVALIRQRVMTKQMKFWLAKYLKHRISNRHN
ncbi:MAG: hypothetical protein IPI79_15330 [Moraxellaceae bacterium]|nr:hypothetical protein [Moraxellaceae bacterium]